MIQATTPTLIFRVKNKADGTPIDLSIADEVYVTIRQGMLTLTKSGDDVSVDVNVVSVWLSQKESLRLSPKAPAKVQINWTYTDQISGKKQRAAAKVKDIKIDEQLLQRVIE